MITLLASSLISLTVIDFLEALTRCPCMVQTHSLCALLNSPIFNPEPTYPRYSMEDRMYFHTWRETKLEGVWRYHLHDLERSIILDQLLRGSGCLHILRIHPHSVSYFVSRCCGAVLVCEVCVLGLRPRHLLFQVFGQVRHSLDEFVCLKHLVPNTRFHGFTLLFLLFCMVIDNRSGFTPFREGQTLFVLLRRTSKPVRHRDPVASRRNRHRRNRLARPSPNLQSARETDRRSQRCGPLSVPRLRAAREPPPLQLQHPPHHGTA
ncbi:hypothetical protein K402DRAFT_85767 [Aulographum hederae CBS 113979]|uniref:Uncharacterized protein n=1 Tax=Aulographum hederae CBS 113979 TaxID=1176131 RepID=A0A6G1GZP8_9PEZI|nr:hypothetical protein K402DRAFT_85767 [Aulographum hederae CBS 113979]